MFSTYSTEGIVDRFMHENRVRLVFLSKVSGACSASTLSAWLKGEARLSAEQQKTLTDTIRILKAVADSMLPVPAAFRDPGLWREIVKREQAKAYGLRIFDVLQDRERMTPEQDAKSMAEAQSRIDARLNNGPLAGQDAKL
jgi:hypothetical protein